MRKRKTRKVFLTIGVVALLLVVLMLYMLFWPVGKTNKAAYIMIDQDDTKDSVFTKLEPVVTPTALKTIKFLTSMTSYGDHIRTGRYEVGKEGAFTTFRHIKNGIQAPMMLTIPSVRTLDRLAEEVGKRMMFSSNELLDSLQDSTVCHRYGFTKETIPCMFIPNTYDLFWNTSITNFLDRMKKEYDRFWTSARKEKAKTIGLTPEEVTTLASIVEEETANDGEKPMVAGMYINRLNIDMLLQADPTVKFALKNFEAKRIYNSMLSADSPYNTYKYKGLPPGPIRIPSVVGIDAVLNHTHHDYLYMCAKEDFSGTHNFAKTFSEHQANAAKYVKALNERGIK
ncbi:MAG: endolytic transglycosylase MltG [Prevotella sp.]|jgi:UPF0755 protein|nr:endolytic transglycosylase MltG [Prevotella sp.]